MASSGALGVYTPAMDKGTSATGTPTAPIDFKGRTIQTYLPNEAQIAVIARMTFWSEANVGADAARMRTGINRVGTLLAGLMVNQDDWDYIEDLMAARAVEWDEVLGIFGLIADAHGLSNRADRRQRKAATPKARRG